MEWSDTALVLSVGRFRESDVWLRMLTRRHGIVSAFAFGGSRSRKRFCGCLDVFNELQINTKSTRNGMYLALQEGTLLNGPRRLRSDWKRLGMFMNCVRFIEALGVPPDGGSSAFALLKDTLALLEQADDVQDVLPALFRLRLASDQGYAPALNACSVCGTSVLDRVGFMVAEGVIVCPRCATGRGVLVEMSGKSLDVLRRVQEESPLHWDFLGTSSPPEGQLLPAQRRECARVVDGFVQYHLGLTWDKGRFRRV
ncbi:MAG: DNA repair protein RecO [Bilophila sp.]